MLEIFYFLPSLFKLIFSCLQILGVHPEISLSFLIYKLEINDLLFFPHQIFTKTAYLSLQLISNNFHGFELQVQMWALPLVVH